MAERLIAPGRNPGPLEARWFESILTHQFSSRVAQWQSTVLIRRGSVDRSHPRVPVSFLGVAQLAARVLWEHEAVRSIRTTETNFNFLVR